MNDDAKMPRTQAAAKGKGKANRNSKPRRACTEKKTPLTMVDVCAGLGGFRLALQHLGVSCVWSSEIDRHAARVYQDNFGDDPTGDLATVKARDVPDHDILGAGFPCQSYSLQGKRRGMDDPRGLLIYHILRILRYRQPRAVVLENVENFRHIEGGSAFANITACLAELGYRVHATVLDARNFGVPQSRRRLFIVGIHCLAKAHPFSFPEGGAPAENLQEILEPDESVPERFDFSETYRTALLRAKDLNRAKGSNHGFDLAKRTHFNALLSRESGTEKNVVIRPDNRWRRPTPLEYQRAQGFPDDFDLSSVSIGRRYNLLGNSVAVPVVRAVAERVVAALTGQPRPGSGPVPPRRRKKGSPKRRTETKTAMGASPRRLNGRGGGAAPSPLSWYGAKNHLAQRIVSLFPPHETYVEPFLGGGSVFFAKPPSRVETVNDIHGDLVNFFRVLREPQDRERLIELVEGTPWSREEFCDAFVARRVGKWASDVERAWTFLVATRQARNGVARCRSDWSRTVGRAGRTATRRTSMWQNLPERLAVAGLRLQEAQLECGHWGEVLDAYDSPHTLAYLDPPYLHSTRNPHNRASYEFEMTNVDHARLLLRIKEYRGKVVLSGYASSLYDELLAGWRRIEIETDCRAQNKANTKHGKRTEVLWLNFEPPASAAA